jgi:hypothetical protein
MKRMVIIMKNRQHDIIEIGGKMMLIGFETLEQKKAEIRMRQDVHNAIVESKREIALIKAVLSL